MFCNRINFGSTSLSGFFTAGLSRTSSCVHVYSGRGYSVCSTLLIYLTPESFSVLLSLGTDTESNPFWETVLKEKKKKSATFHILKCLNKNASNAYIFHQQQLTLLCPFYWWGLCNTDMSSSLTKIIRVFFCLEGTVSFEACLWGLDCLSSIHKPIAEPKCNRAYWF